MERCHRHRIHHSIARPARRPPRRVASRDPGCDGQEEAHMETGRRQLPHPMAMRCESGPPPPRTSRRRASACMPQGQRSLKLKAKAPAAEPWAISRVAQLHTPCLTARDMWHREHIAHWLLAKGGWNTTEHGDEHRSRRRKSPLRCHWALALRGRGHAQRAARPARGATQAPSNRAAAVHRRFRASSAHKSTSFARSTADARHVGRQINQAV